ncbi:MAG: hypothetical protein HRT46_11750, partial [Deltaproteobacteria bacterium]|nr:hypothetical protein [Deltaproteobacteria bacterium]
SSDAGDGRTTSVDSAYGINFRGVINSPFVGPVTYLKDTPRDPNDILTLDYSLTWQQKAQLGCGPAMGTRCDSGAAVVRVRLKNCSNQPALPYAPNCQAWANIAGTIDIEYERIALTQPDLYDIVDENGNICPPNNLDPCRIWGRGGGIDFQLADASVILQSFVGIEGTEGSTNTPLDFSQWVTWAADTAQPGTIGLVGLKGFGDSVDRKPKTFDGAPNCTRYDPKNPLADKSGVVLQPGCRGAITATVNRRDINNANDNTVDVQFDPGYDPRVDGCMFGRSMSIQTPFGREFYWVRAVKSDGETLNEGVTDALYETCFNSNNEFIAGVNPTTPGFVPGTDVRVNSHWRDPTWYSFTRSSTKRDGEDISLLVPGSQHRFHPLAQCEQAGTGVDGLPAWRPNTSGSTPENQVTTAVGLCTSFTRDYEADFIQGNASVFKNELAAVSFNLQTFLVTVSCNKISANDDLDEGECFNPLLPWAVGRCSFSTPQFCRNVRGFLGVGGVQRNDPRAGGNNRFGRRTFIWQGGADLALKYKRRNVFGISADFAEDNTKTNWGVEFTYIAPTPWIDNNSYTSTTDSSAFNLTISIDRPTFINFLNANRTFFFNTQWFFNYLPNWNEGFTTFGNPFNVLFTFAVFTGYYQDRLLPQLVTVYDFSSQSAGFLPQLGYRFTEAFSVTFGVSFFVGRDEYVRMPVRGFAPPTNRAGPHKYEDGVNRLLANFMRRDEFWMRLRWTF